MVYISENADEIWINGRKKGHNSKNYTLLASKTYLFKVNVLEIED